MFKRALPTFFAIILMVFAGSVFGQNLNGTHGLGMGINLGLNQQYSEARSTPFGPGVGLYYLRNLSDRFNLRLEGGYNQLAIRVGNPLKKYTTDLIYLDLVGGFDLKSGSRLRPFVEGGIGAFNFNMIGTAGKRYFDGEFMLGGGLRWLLSQKFALSLSGDLKYTTGDGLDGNLQGGNSIMDMYFSIRSGLTMRMGKKSVDSGIEGENFTDNLEIEDLSGDENMTVSDLDAEPGADDNLLKQLSGMDDIQLAGQGGNSLAMQEYNRLKTRIEELKGSIDSRETEIFTLRKTMGQTDKNKTETDAESEFLIVENNYNQTMVSSITQFSSGYESALNLFYSHRYQDAVDKFQALMAKFPNHVLVSNCEYWVGECFFYTGNFTRAIVSFDRALAAEQSLKKDDALLMIGRSYIELGDDEKAHDALARLLREFPDSEHLQKARELL